MTIDQAVANILDETIQALTLLDLNRLQNLEKQISALAESNVVCGRDSFNSIQTKKHLLELLLQNCESNLDALNRLHRRNTRDRWAH
jgi:hypothetical protein